MIPTISETVFWIALAIGSIFVMLKVINSNNNVMSQEWQNRNR